MSDGQVDLSNSTSDVELKEKTWLKAEDEKGKQLLKEEKKEENSEKIEDKINLNKVSFPRR